MRSLAVADVVLAGSLAACCAALLGGDGLKPAELTTGFISPTRGQQLLPMGGVVIMILAVLAVRCVARRGLDRAALLFVFPLLVVVADERVNVALLWVRQLGWSKLALGGWSDLGAGLLAIVALARVAWALSRDRFEPVQVSWPIVGAVLAAVGFGSALLGDRYRIGTGPLSLTEGGLFHGSHALASLVGADAVLATFTVGTIVVGILGPTRRAALAYAGIGFAALAHDNVRLHDWLISRGPVGARTPLYVGAASVVLVWLLAAAIASAPRSESVRPPRAAVEAQSA